MQAKAVLPYFDCIKIQAAPMPASFMNNFSTRVPNAS